MIKMFTCNVGEVSLLRYLCIRSAFHKVQPSTIYHCIENLRVVSFSVATKCYSINCARKTFSYNLSQVQEMNYAFYFYPTVHSQKSTNIIQEDTCFCRTILVFVGGNGIKTDLYRTYHYIYIEILTAIEKSEPKWKLTLPNLNKQLCKVLNGV